MFILVVPLCLVLVSYSRILLAILRIQSGEGRRKAFSTCSSHLCVVGLFFGSAIVMYMVPKSRHPEEQQKILFLFYSFFNPMLKPLIYSLRNAEVKGALKRVLYKESHSQLEWHWNPWGLGYRVPPKLLFLYLRLNNPRDSVMYSLFLFRKYLGFIVFIIFNSIKFILSLNWIVS